MISLGCPQDGPVHALIASWKDLPYSYDAVGATRGDPPPRFRLDRLRERIGQGESAWHRAKEALRRWEMFPATWTRVHGADPSLREGTIVAVLVRTLGLWWVNACKVVYTFEETTPVERFGFAYGTLSPHAEAGEERFAVERDPHDDSVWYGITAISRPRSWIARIGAPHARRLQARFRADSLAAMRRVVSR